MLSEIYRERQTLYDFTYMWNLKDNKRTKKKKQHKTSENKWAMARGESIRGWVKKLKGIKRYKLVVTQWVKSWGCKVQCRKTSNNTTIYLYDNRWLLDLSWWSFHMRRRKWQPTPDSCLENPRDRGAWWAAIYGVTQSRTQLQRLSSSSSSSYESIWCIPTLLQLRKQQNIWLIHVDVWKKPTQYCKAIILQLKINNFFKRKQKLNKN